MNEIFEKYNGNWIVLTGLGEFSTIEYNDNLIDGWCFEINGKIYHTYEDPSDGYRSLSIIEKGYYQEWNEELNRYIDVKPDHMTYIPPQLLKLKTEAGEEYGEKFWKINLYNDVDELVLEVGTENYDDYYPRAIFHWHPENLTINKNKNENSRKN